MKEKVTNTEKEIAEIKAKHEDVAVQIADLHKENQRKTEEQLSQKKTLDELRLALD